MSFTILNVTFRKRGTTPEQFKTHYEGKHMPLLRDLAGSNFPLSHTRRYIARTEGMAGDSKHNAKYAAAILKGSQADFEYDAIIELTFRDEAAYRDYLSVINKPDVAAKIAADEELFLDRSRMPAVVLGEVSTTTGPRYWEKLRGLDGEAPGGGSARKDR